MSATDESPLAAHAASPAELRERLAVERLGDPFVVFRHPQRGQVVLPLPPGMTRVTIGRGPANNVALGWDTEVSRLHAQLERLGGEWTVTDDGLSRNGTYVNGERIGGRCRLRDGDVIQVGRTPLAYRQPALEQADETAVAGRSAVPKLTPAQRRVLESLCRPYKESDFAAPAPNTQIAEELFLSVDAVKAHLRALFVAFGLEELPQNQKRSALVRRALQSGVVSTRDL